MTSGRIFDSELFAGVSYTHTQKKKSPRVLHLELENLLKLVEGNFEPTMNAHTKVYCLNLIYCIYENLI